MMTGRLYIDGHDAYTTFGVYVMEGGYNDLVALPPLKSPTTNDWQEEDGIEADLSAPVLDTHEVSLKLAVSGLYSRYFALLQRLSDKAYHTFECAEIGRTFRLRLTQMSSLDAVKILGFATLKLADDFPPTFDEWGEYLPRTAMVACEDYTLDDRNFTDYGVRILQGSLSEILKQPQVKPNLLRNIPSQQGVIYDNAVVTFKSKEVKLTCLARASSLDDLWHNLECLLHDLTRPEERRLGVREIEDEFPCYYKSCAVSEFYADAEPWLKFTLTFVFTQAFRLNDDDFVLAAENGIIIFTEDGYNAIEMLPDLRRLDHTMRFVNNRSTLRLTANGTIRFNN